LNNRLSKVAASSRRHQSAHNSIPSAGRDERGEGVPWFDHNHNHNLNLVRCPPSFVRRYSLITFLFFLSLSAIAAPVQLPANDAFTQWIAQHKASPPSSQDIAAGLKLVQSRAAELKALLQSDPAQFISRSMPASDRASLPPEFQSFVEHRVKNRGSFRVYCAGLPREKAEPAHPHPHGDYGYEVQINGVTYHASVFGNWFDQTSVREADIEGVVLDDAIAIGDSPTPTEQAVTGGSVTADSPTLTGPNTLLYMIARFSDETSDPIDDATALARTTVISNFWMNNSSGTVGLKGLVNPNQTMDIVHVTLPQPTSYGPTYNANFAQLLSDARTAASAAGFNYANYNLDVVVTTGSGFSYAGRSYIGAQGSHWLNSYTTLRTGGHELGHNLGLYHANYWRTDSTQPFGKDSNPGGYVVDSFNGEWVEYGHYFSVMSAQYGGEWDDATKPHYSPAEKVRLGWLSGPEIQFVTANGTYRLFRHDARSTVGNPRGIRIETPATDYTGLGRRYWLDYRYAPWSTAQNWYQNGLCVNVAQTSYGSDGSILLDMTPYTSDQPSPFYDPSSPPGGWWTIDNSDKLDGALVVGRTFNDVPAGIHLTPIATGNNGTGEEYIDVVVNLGTFPANHAPAISSFSATATSVTTGQPVNFAVSATDADGDTLAYSWDFDEVQTWTASGLNSSTATKSWSSSGQYRVKVTVSDMKGGVTSESQIITVGAPANNAEIWGRVVWAGQPVFNARVSTTSGAQAWSDSDGTYVLTDLTPGGSYTLACSAPNLTFTQQLPNPVSLAAGNVFGADFYANELLSAGGGATFSISGQVTDGGSPVVGAEVRAGGMLDTTDTSGNYQITNLINGNYTVTASKDNWTFSPASRSVTISSANSTGNNFSRAAPYSITGTFSGIPAQSQSPAPTVYLSNGRSAQATRQGTGPNRFWGYTINNVPSGQYSVSAELSGYTFAPSGFSNPLTVSGALSGINFNGTAATVAGAISGRITQLGLPLAGANVSASQGGTTVATTSTDSDGYYRIDNLANGSYAATPSKSGFSFSPSSLSATFVPMSGLDFTAVGTATAPTITSIMANPASIPGPNSTTTLSVVASGSGTLTYSWAATVSQGPVSFSGNDSASANNTVVSFVAAGSYTFRVRVTDANGFSKTSTVNVVVSAGIGSMVVAPFEVQIPGGQTVNFHADAWDQLGNRITVSPAWSASGGGTIDTTGAFSSSTAGGPFAISATAGGLSATGFVWVTSSASNQAPLITSQPQSRTNVAGTTASFTAMASGSAPLSYQWLFNSAPLASGTSSILSLPNVQPADAGSYSVVVTNTLGSATSGVAMLTVTIPPTIGTQPQSQTNIAGTTALFYVGATGTAPLNYQWKFGSANLAGATSSALTLTNIQASNVGNYTVVVSNVAGSTTSSVAVLTVWVPPAVTIQPLSRTNVAGTTATFSVNATGTAPLSYQWQLNNSPLGGASGSALTLTNVQTSDAGNYAVIVTNVAGSVTSSVATLTVWVPPTLAAQPQSRTNIAGTTATFTVSATGTTPLSYQWRLNNSLLGGANGSALTLTNVQTSDAGNYSVVITNVAGAITSSPAALTIWVPPQITIQPQSQTNIAGTTVSFSVTATGTAPLSYQWLLSSNNIIGATGTILTLTNVGAINAGIYSVLVTNVAGLALSSNATLTVIQPVAISSQPLSQFVAAGSNVTFIVGALGTPPLVYQWSLNGLNIAGATASLYVRTNAQTADAGNYTVTITNLGGGATSDPAVLTVNNAPILTAIPDKIIHAGSMLVVTNTANDIDLPLQNLTFTLDPGAPAGAAMDGASGVLTWPTTVAQSGTTNAFTVRVTDNGIPSQSDVKSFLATVVAPLSFQSIIVSNSIVALTWQAIPGVVYQIQYKPSLSDSNWTALPPDIRASGTTASATDTAGSVQRFYRVMMLP
jgi:hypothetical protein